MKIRIYYEDTDAGGIVYHSRYINFCERARSEIFYQNGKSPVIGNCHFAVKSIQADFVKPARLGDILEIKTVLLELKNASFALHQEIFKDDMLIFKMDIKLVFLCPENGAKISKINRETKVFLASLF